MQTHIDHIAEGKEENGTDFAGRVVIKIVSSLL
jgi:hypothetical protein